MDLSYELCCLIVENDFAEAIGKKSDPEASGTAIFEEKNRKPEIVEHRRTAGKTGPAIVRTDYFTRDRFFHNSIDPTFTTACGNSRVIFFFGGGKNPSNLNNFKS